MGLTSSTIASTEEIAWSVTITLDYDALRITYVISSLGLIQKKISSEAGQEVIFNVDAVDREMVDLTKAHVGKDGNFDSCLNALTNLISTITTRWTDIKLDAEVKPICSSAPEPDYKWVAEIKMPSDAKVVDYTITSDNATVVKKVTCVTTQKSSVFNAELAGNTNMVDPTPTGSDGERDKLLEVLTTLCNSLVKY